MARIVLNLAVSLDGYIADKNGGFGWIIGDGDKSHDTEKQFDFEEFTGTIDTIIMGRKAYEDCPKETLYSFKDKKIYVATHKNLEGKLENVEEIKGGVIQKVTDLLKGGGKDVWLYGGAGLTDEFIKADVIDEYIIGIIPTILGKGRPLFLGENPKIRLHLEEVTSQEGIIIMRYSKRD